MKRVARFICKFYPTMIVVGVILYATLSSDPTGDISFTIPHIDKLIHAVMMGGLVSAVAFDLRRANRSEQLGIGLMTKIALWVMVASVADELAQSWLTANRSGEMLDLLADWTGIWVAVLTAPPAIRRVLPLR